jgi:hypothetical protein
MRKDAPQVPSVYLLTKSICERKDKYQGAHELAALGLPFDVCGHGATSSSTTCCTTGPNSLSLDCCALCLFEFRLFRNK